MTVSVHVRFAVDQVRLGQVFLRQYLSTAAPHLLVYRQGIELAARFNRDRVIRVNYGLMSCDSMRWLPVS